MKIPAYRVGGQLWCWCAHEQRWHYHGLGDGDRASHCVCPASPLWRGYSLREVGPLTPEIEKAHRVPRHRHRCPVSVR